ncbi:sugar-binding domain-containing protein [Paenibacillus nasutitermitis]|uniref:Beta-galactosidase n=1 Tax=Paenibacillus nasutitermitis TaxID=1652958 RepID=A0A916YQA2_9BACL|nr:sugar-binding domain-containing protein [Paenibacillus nasutitermitis]GGD56233.1 beta-galactosidase [Paenibacillus nasutitermitis]
MTHEIPIDPMWRFQLDPGERVQAESTAVDQLESRISVHGSWEEQGYGERSAHQPIGTWKKKKEYTGTAWYGTVIDLPEYLEDYHFRLIISGVHWQTALWVNGQAAGQRQSLVNDHCYELGEEAKAGGSCELLIRVNNEMRMEMEETHIHSYHTATNWGGITGGVRLEAVPRVSMREITLTPDAERRQIGVVAKLGGNAASGESALYSVEVRVKVNNGLTVIGAAQPDEEGTAAVELELGLEAELWSDSNPQLYTADVFLKREGRIVDAQTRRFGLRNMKADGTRLMLNGEAVFLRGYVDCCVFPLTGYPVWDIEVYRRQFRIARSYGFNHVRLHGWSPPKPFWLAADEEGMLVQTELPQWSRHYRTRSRDADSEAHSFYRQELKELLGALNEHPSFVLLSMGNELIGKEGHAQLNELVREARETDPTRLYTDNTGFGHLPEGDREGDFYIPTLNWHPPVNTDFAATPDTTQDFAAVTRLGSKPMLAHEHGQFTMYVRPQEEEKYTGALEPSWLSYINENLQYKQWEGRLPEFQRITGSLLMDCLKEAMERARRTPDLAGIQLLDIRDFPGQGHATTGFLDVFWDEKGITTPEAVRAFNGETVLLMRSGGRTFFEGEQAKLALEISHYGSGTLDEALINWSFADQDGVLASGIAEAGSIEKGRTTRLQPIAFVMPEGTAGKIKFSVALSDGSRAINANEWSFWVFPRVFPQEHKGQVLTNIDNVRTFLQDAVYSQQIGIHWLSYRVEAGTKLIIADRMSKELLQFMHDGGSVWLMPAKDALQDSISIHHLPIFWNYLWFPNQRGTTMGLILNEHPALGRFPHEGQTDWHLYGMTEHSVAVSLDAMPSVEPIVEVIDHFARMKRLASVFECRVGAGKLFVSTLRLTDEDVCKKPETLFLFHEIFTYLMSEKFSPAARISAAELLAQFPIAGVSYDVI